jgi:ferric-dicitrate binding protein FerR (iron transport regulator)
MHRWLKLAIAVAVVVSFASGLTTPSGHAEDRRTVGLATKVVSPAEVEKQPAAVGTLAHMNDELRTGANARLQVSFRDSTELNLGENATVVVDRFVYDPDASTGQVVLKTGVAALRMATGKISEMQNKKITVAAPFATIGVRGTDFWLGPIDGHFGVLMLSQSRVEVRNDAGAVLIDKAGWGTDIHAELKGGYGRPSPPYRWDAAKVQRAVNQTNVPLFPPLNPGVLAPAVFPAIVIPQLQSEPTTTNCISQC